MPIFLLHRPGGGWFADQVRSFSAPVAALLIVAFVAAPWAVYQWMELVLDHAGGALACNVDEVFNCTAVWEAPLAKSIHRFTGLPVAAWGVVWAFAAFVAALQVALRSEAAEAVAGARVVAVGGLVGVFVLSGVSLSLGVVCPTCLATYVLVLAYAGLAFFGMSGGGFPVRGLAVPAGAVAIGWLALLGPGRATSIERDPGLPPRVAGAPSKDEPAPEDGAPDTGSEAELRALVASLPPQGKAMLAESLESLRKPPAAEPPATPRPRHGKGPLVITDFSDLRCTHCRALAAALHELESRVGERFTKEARYFPLSSNCNPKLPEAAKDPTGARCFAAKSLICLEDHPRSAELRLDLFEKQEELSIDFVAERAEAITGTARAELDACQDRADVAAKLAEDIAYAGAYAIQGTPLVLLNGREVMAHPVILYALILAHGRPDHPAFSEL